MPVYCGLRALVVDRAAHQAREKCRGRGAVVDRGHGRRPPPPHQSRARATAASSSRPAKMRSPTPLGPSPVWRSIQRDARRAPAVRAQHLAQGQVAPGGRWCRRRRGRPETRTGRAVMAAWKAASPCVATIAADGGDVGRRGRPFLGQQQRVQVAVGLVDRQRLAEVLEVAVQVHVLVGGAADVRKAVGIERVDVQHGNAEPAARARATARRCSAATCTPLPQKPSTPWQALLRISSLSALGWPSRTTSIASCSPSRPLQRMRLGLRLQARALGRASGSCCAPVRRTMRKRALIGCVSCCAVLSPARPRPAAPSRSRPAGSGRR